MHRPAPLRQRLFALALLVFGSLGCAAAWILVAAALDRQCSWMALVAALDAALLLRFARFPPGLARASAGVAGTALAIAVAGWGVAAAHIGRSLGLLPWESALKLGPEFAWLLIRLGHGPGDLLWLGAGLVLAAIASR